MRLIKILLVLLLHCATTKRIVFLVIRFQRGKFFSKSKTKVTEEKIMSVIKSNPTFCFGASSDFGLRRLDGILVLPH